MTTIKITDGHEPDEASIVMVEVHLTYAPKPGEWNPPATSPILLGVSDAPGYEAAGAWLSPSKAREVIAALQAAVDEVEPPGLPNDEDRRPRRLARKDAPGFSFVVEVPLNVPGGISAEAFTDADLDTIQRVGRDYETNSTEINLGVFDKLVAQARYANRLRAALAELVDFAEGVAVGHDVPKFFRNEAENVARHRAVLPPRER